MNLITRHTEGTVLDWLEEKLGASRPLGPHCSRRAGGQPFSPEIPRKAYACHLHRMTKMTGVL
jgi:hypothetical protein